MILVPVPIGNFLVLKFGIDLGISKALDSKKITDNVLTLSGLLCKKIFFVSVNILKNTCYFLASTIPPCLPQFLSHLTHIYYNSYFTNRSALETLKIIKP